MAKKNGATIQSVSDIRTSVARMLALAKNCEAYIKKPNDPTAKRNLNKLLRISQELERTANKKDIKSRNLMIGVLIDNLYSIYSRYKDDKINNDKLKSLVFSTCPNIYGDELKATHLKSFSKINKDLIRENRGCKATAVIKIAKALGFAESHVWDINEKYSQNKQQLAGLPHGVENNYSYRSFKEEPNWRFLAKYYLGELMGLTPKDRDYIIQYIENLDSK